MLAISPHRILLDFILLIRKQSREIKNRARGELKCSCPFWGKFHEMQPSN